MKKRVLIIMMACILATGCSQAADDKQSTATTVAETETTGAGEENASEEIEAEDSVVEQEDESTEAENEEADKKEEVTEMPMYADFVNGCPATFEPSGDWTNGSMFNVTWRKTSCSFEDEKLQLTIDFDEQATSIPYKGAELRSKDFYGYGRYEVSMKAIKNDGVVSSFFTYTGPSDNNPWDEIDVEILGKDTTQVQFNYFTDSKGNHEKLVDLGFDASEDFHTYAFEWRENQIDWYVDGELVHTATDNIPVTRSKIMMNAWAGTGVDGWLKAFDDSNLPLTAEYQWISYTPFED